MNPLQIGFGSFQPIEICFLLKSLSQITLLVYIEIKIR